MSASAYGGRGVELRKPMIFFSFVPILLIYLTSPKSVYLGGVTNFTMRSRMYRPRTFVEGSYVPWTLDPLEDEYRSNLTLPSPSLPFPLPSASCISFSVFLHVCRQRLTGKGRPKPNHTIARKPCLL
jgi:hypothetical protein